MTTKTVMKAQQPLPGFKRVSGGSFPPTLDFKVGIPVVGAVESFRTVSQKFGKDVRDTRIISILTEAGLRSVWESASLTGLFDEAKVGDEVWILYTGDVSIKGRKMPMHSYETAIRPAGSNEDA